MTGGGMSDIYKGTYKGMSVALKLPKICMRTLSAKEKDVSLAQVLCTSRELSITGLQGVSTGNTPFVVPQAP